VNIYAQAGPGIPVYDKKSDVEQITFAIKTANNWITEADRWTQNVNFINRNFETIAGLREIQSLGESIMSLKNNIEATGERYSNLVDLASNPKSLLQGEAKRLLEKLEIYDNCKDIKDDTQKKICEYEFVSRLEDSVELDRATKDTQEDLKKLTKISEQMKNSTDPKMSQDLLNSATIIQTKIEVRKAQADLILAKTEKTRQINQERQKQYQIKIMETPRVWDFSDNNNDNNSDE
jgi:hypothetical protein